MALMIVVSVAIVGGGMWAFLLPSTPGQKSCAVVPVPHESRRLRSVCSHTRNEWDQR
jgi:hypothetical protein